MADETRNTEEITEEKQTAEEVTENTAQETPEESQDTAEKEAADSEQEEADAQEKPKKLFGKKKEKKDKKDEKIEELTDQIKRQMAEFDNYRKRTEKEKASMYVIGAKDIVEKILPVVDNFERGLAAAADKADDPFVDGMSKIYKQLMTTLEELGVSQIEAVGKEFDPNFHNAVMHVEDENFGENTVAEVFQAGFRLGDKVIRFAMVKVAN